MSNNSPNVDFERLLELKQEFLSGELDDDNRVDPDQSLIELDKFNNGDYTYTNPSRDRPLLNVGHMCSHCNIVKLYGQSEYCSYCWFNIHNYEKETSHDTD